MVRLFFQSCCPSPDSTQLLQGHSNWRFLPRSGKQDRTDGIAMRANCEDAERPLWLPERCVCPVDAPADTKDHADNHQAWVTQQALMPQLAHENTSRTLPMDLLKLILMNKLGMVAWAINPRTQEAEEVKSLEFETSLVYTILQDYQQASLDKTVNFVFIDRPISTAELNPVKDGKIERTTVAPY
ncbi:hypothetical protein STEG23_016120 [Scotinomys teguina]